MKYIIDYTFLILGSLCFLLSTIFNLFNPQIGMLIFTFSLFIGFLIGNVKRKMSMKNKVIFLLVLLYLAIRNCYYLLK